MSDHRSTPLMSEGTVSDGTCGYLWSDLDLYEAFGDDVIQQLQTDFGYTQASCNSLLEQNDAAPSASDNLDSLNLDFSSPAECASFLNFDDDENDGFYNATNANAGFLDAPVPPPQNASRLQGEPAPAIEEQHSDLPNGAFSRYSQSQRTPHFMEVPRQYSNDTSVDCGDYKWAQDPQAVSDIQQAMRYFSSATPQFSLQHFGPSIAQPGYPFENISHHSMHQGQDASSDFDPLARSRAKRSFKVEDSSIQGIQSTAAAINPIPGVGSNQTDIFGHSASFLQPEDQIARRSTRQNLVQPPACGQKFLCKESGCKRGVREEHGYCKRHQDKFNRNHAGPPQIRYRADITFDTAKAMAYPTYHPLPGAQDDKTLPHPDLERSTEDRWVQRFLVAACTPVSDPDPLGFEQQQQNTFNGKARMEKAPDGRYSENWINARMRMLYRTVLVFHRGGEAVYPVGGDNGGYGKPEKKFDFKGRLETLEESMRKDKLTVMNVIEGRGVVALVQNPERFQKRKTQNKSSNQKKDQVLEAERKRVKGPTTGKDTEHTESEFEVKPRDGYAGISFDAAWDPPDIGTSTKRKRESGTPQDGGAGVSFQAVGHAQPVRTSMKRKRESGTPHDLSGSQPKRTKMQAATMSYNEEPRVDQPQRNLLAETTTQAAHGSAEYGTNAQIQGKRLVDAFASCFEDGVDLDFEGPYNQSTLNNTSSDNDLNTDSKTDC